MKMFKKLLDLTLSIIIITALLLNYNFKTKITNSNINTRKPINVGVLFYTLDDLYLSLVKQNLEEIQKENQDKIKFTFFDGKSNPAIQNIIVDELIESNFDLIVISIFEKNPEILKDIFYKIENKNIPLILFASSVFQTNIDDTYSKFAIISGDIKQPAELEGKILVDKWKSSKESIDKNGDNILQYIMLKGNANSSGAITRTKSVIETINKSGIQTKELASVTANWNKELAKDAIYSLFLQYGPNIEAIIANNDAMAIGAVEALQKYGYNIGDKSKTIDVLGIDAIPAAQDLIKKGFMTGSVLQKPDEMAQAIYAVGMNLVSGNPPAEGTNYFTPFDPRIIFIGSFQEYTIDTEQSKVL